MNKPPHHCHIYSAVLQSFVFGHNLFYLIHEHLSHLADALMQRVLQEQFNFSALLKGTSTDLIGSGIQTSDFSVTGTTLINIMMSCFPFIIKTFLSSLWSCFLQMRHWRRGKDQTLIYLVLCHSFLALSSCRDTHTHTHTRATLRLLVSTVATVDPHRCDHVHNCTEFKVLYSMSVLIGCLMCSPVTHSRQWWYGIVCGGEWVYWYGHFPYILSVVVILLCTSYRWTEGQTDRWAEFACVDGW